VREKDQSVRIITFFKERGKVTKSRYNKKEDSAVQQRDRNKSCEGQKYYRKENDRERERVFNIERIILLIVDANRDLSEQWPSHDRVK
jgi:hypothetical protein